MRNNTKKKGIWDSIFAVLDYLFRIVMINLLIIIPAFFPVVIYSWLTGGDENPNELVMYITLIPALVYTFPAIVAACDVYRMYQEKLTKGVFKEFFKSFKKYFLKSFIISLIAVSVFIILTFRLNINGIKINGPLIYFFENFDNLICLIGLGITLSFVIIGCFLIIHLPLVMSYFEGLSLWQYFKLAFIMAFKKVGITILLLIIIVAFILIDLSFGIVTFIFGVSVPIYLLIKLSFKEYIKICRKVERREDEN